MQALRVAQRTPSLVRVDRGADAIRVYLAGSLIWRWPIVAPIEWRCKGSRLLLHQPRWVVRFQVDRGELAVAWTLHQGPNFASAYAWTAASRRLLVGALARFQGAIAVQRFLRGLPPIAEDLGALRTGPLRVEVLPHGADAAQLRVTCGGVLLHALHLDRVAALRSYHERGFVITMCETFQANFCPLLRVPASCKPLVRLITARSNSHELTYVPPALLDAAVCAHLEH